MICEENSNLCRYDYISERYEFFAREPAPFHARIKTLQANMSKIIAFRIVSLTSNAVVNKDENTKCMFLATD
jgi:hypothetical protein